jgi:hypothetical protein
MAMTFWKTSRRLAVPAGLAALMLAAGGTLSYASAANWTYMNDYEGNCLISSTTSDDIKSGACNDSLSTRNWHWGTQTTTGFGYTFRRLVSNANGDCLTTDFKSANNAVWASPCGSGGMQWWNGDGNMLMNTYSHQLRSSANGDAVYSSTGDVVGQIEPERWVWWGAHD